MYYFNILEPRFICDKAIKVLNQEQTRISKEIGKLESDKEQGIGKHLKIGELKMLQADYYRLIEELKQLGDFGVQQMEEIATKGKRKGNCIF